MSEILQTELFDPDFVVERMMNDGAVALPLIEEDFRSHLLRLAEIYDFSAWQKYEGKHVKSIGSFDLLRTALEDLINNVLRKAEPQALAEEFHFNMMELNRYLPGGAISNHTDGPSFKGIISIVVIDGKANFYSVPTSDFRNFAAKKRRISSNPGDVIFMRAPGFLGTTDAIRHQVTRASTRRFSLAFRLNTANFYKPYEF